jgi:Undecaprenyl-phosphate glucose phosphotransferase
MEQIMSEQIARKRLFTETHRRRPHTGAPRPRLLGGQAMAEAQRLSVPSMKPAVLGYNLAALDALVVGLAGFGNLALESGPLLSEGAGVWVVWLGVACVLLVSRLIGGYGFRRMRSMAISVSAGLVSVALGLGAVTLLLVAAGMQHATIDPWVLAWALMAAPAMILARVGMALRIGALARTGRLEHRIVLVGGGNDLSPMIEEVDRERGRGRRLCGFFDERRDQRSPGVVAGHHKTGDIDDLVEFARLAKIDTVIIAIPGASEARIRDLLGRLFVLPVDIRVLEGADIPAYSRKKRSRIGPYKLIEIYKRPIDGFAAARKRAFDLVFGTLALITFAPLMAVIALAIKLESPGPVLFRQKRHGYNNKPIEVLKFRSMYVDQCDATAVKAVRRGDARVTRIGRFIRRASIDELPQFVNVLRGELSLVGPRPHATSARTGDFFYDQVIDTYSARHKVKPGVTGWAQINGWRGELNTPDKIRQRVEHDLYYIENWSLWLDFKIMMKTPMSLITTKNAY